MDEPIEEMLRAYAAAMLRHQQHLEDRCDRRAWHVLARHRIQRAVWSANSADEPVSDGRPMPWNPTLLDRDDR
ncbi:MAG TPA: hypothetical protein VN771_02775 [Candidatus Baltobacteraceae bacterium]|nr:hypothetical protein [Candidatus Baltobacteraceae bacterium]